MAFANKQVRLLDASHSPLCPNSPSGAHFYDVTPVPEQEHRCRYCNSGYTLGMANIREVMSMDWNDSIRPAKVVNFDQRHLGAE